MCSHSSEQINSGICWTKAQNHHQKYYWMEWEIKEEARYEAWDFLVCAVIFLFDTCFIFGKHLLVTYFPWFNADLTKKQIFPCFSYSLRTALTWISRQWFWTWFCVSGKQTSAYTQPSQWICPSGLDFWKFSVTWFEGTVWITVPP